MGIFPKGCLGPARAPPWDSGGWWGDQEALLPTGALHPRPPVPSPPRSVGMWASGMYPVIRATQQAGRGLREGAVEAAAACPAQGAKAGRLGCGVHCLASPPLASTGSAAAGSGLLAEAPSCSPHAGTPWPARPRLGLRPPWCGPLRGLLLLLVSRGHCLGTWGDLAGGWQGLEASPWGCLGVSPPGWDRLGRGQRKGGPLGRWWGWWWGKVIPGCSRGELLLCQFCG